MTDRDDSRTRASDRAARGEAGDGGRGESVAAGDGAGDEGFVTERTLERAREDRRFVPVIVKRSDETGRHPDDVLQEAIDEGATQARRSTTSLALSSVAAGAILAFTAMAVGLGSVATASIENEIIARLLVALLYPLGFILCLLSGSQLFTEHTALAVFPVLDRRCGVRALGRVWATVLFGNLVGCLVGAVLLVSAEQVIGAREGYAIVAAHFIESSFGVTLVSAVLAGWLMALGGWLVLSADSAIARIALVYAVTFLIGFGGLHHSIAGSAEMFAAHFTQAPVAIGGTISAITAAIIGNLIGGSVFVALLNHAHIRRADTVDAASE